MANPETATDDTENERFRNWKALPDGSFIWQRNSKAEARIVPSDVLDQLKRLKNLELVVSLALGVPLFLLLILAVKQEVPVAWTILALIAYGGIGTALHLHCKTRMDRLEQRHPKAGSILQPINLAETFLAGMPDTLLRRTLFLAGGGALASVTELGSLLIRGEPFTNGKQTLSSPALLLIVFGGAFAAYHLNRERIRRKHARQA